MKNIARFCVLAFLFSAQALAAQQWGGLSDYLNPLHRNGTVSIGFNDPPASLYGAKLLLNGNMVILPGLNNGGHITMSGDIKGQASSTGGFNILFNTTATDGASLQSATSGMGMLFTAKQTGGLRLKLEGTGQVDFWTPTAEMMRLQRNGKVVIGGSAVSEAPDGFRLAVGEGIITPKVKICPNVVAWCDYVFDNDYIRNSIEYVARYIAEHKHLPNVPSAKEVAENGVDVVEMDAILLRQVEELWLHLIDLKKENEELKERLAKLEDRLSGSGATEGK